MGILGLIAAFIGNLFQMFGQQSANNQNLLAVQQANATNERINQTQMQHEDTAAEAADQRTRALYRDIESPKAKVGALMDAGLSPGLIYGQGGIGGSLASGAQAQTQGLIPAMAPQMQNVMGLLNPNIMMENLKAEAEIKKIESETERNLADLPLKDKMLQQMNQEILNKKQEIAESQEKVNLMFAERMHEYKKSNLTEKQKELTEAQKAYYDALENLTSINASDAHTINEATINEAKAKGAEAFSLAKKAGVETKLMEKNMQQVLDLTYYQMCNEMYKFLKLGPEEWHRLQADVEKLKIANDKEKAIGEIYGSWKGHARANEIKEWLKALAGVGGAAGIITSAAKTAAKAAPK